MANGDGTDSNSVDLTASTGVNDVNSPWNGLLQSALNTGLQVGGQELSSALKLQTPIQGNSNGSGAPNPAAPGGAVTQTIKSNSGVIVVAAVILAALAYLLFIRK